MRLKKTYSSREVAAVTGLSARQLQIWHAGGLMPPAVPPRRTAAGGYTERRYTPIELFELLALAELRERGFSVAQLQVVVDALRDHFATRLFDVTGGGGELRLLTDDHDVFVRTSSGEFFSLLHAPTQPMLAVGDLDRVREVGGQMPRKRRRRRPGARAVSGSETPSPGRRPDAE